MSEYLFTHGQSDEPTPEMIEALTREATQYLETPAPIGESDGSDPIAPIEATQADPNLSNPATVPEFANRSEARACLASGLSLLAMFGAGETGHQYISAGFAALVGATALLGRHYHYH